MSDLQIIAQILEDQWVRFQDPSITKTRGRNPRYVIRPVVPMLTPSGVERRQKTIPLGRVAEMTMKQAQRGKPSSFRTRVQGGSNI